MKFAVLTALALSSTALAGPFFSKRQAQTCAQNLDCPVTQYCNQQNTCTTCSPSNPLSGPPSQAVRDPYQAFQCDFPVASSATSAPASSAAASASAVPSSSFSSSAPAPSASACGTYNGTILCRDDSECGAGNRCQYVTRNPVNIGCDGYCTPIDQVSSSAAPSGSASASSSAASASASSAYPDCRTTGCSHFESCVFVKQGYVCIQTPVSSSSESAVSSASASVSVSASVTPSPSASAQPEPSQSSGQPESSKSASQAEPSKSTAPSEPSVVPQPQPSKAAEPSVAREPSKAAESAEPAHPSAAPSAAPSDAPTPQHSSPAASASAAPAPSASAHPAKPTCDVDLSQVLKYLKEIKSELECVKGDVAALKAKIESW
ncbi:hypothetical protein IAU60_004911 [Kwoniella sp. DSM 27419]